jgi:predicted chitinase
MRAKEFLYEAEIDPLDNLLQKKGLAPKTPEPTVKGVSQIDQDKLDQIIQRLSAGQEPEPAVATAVTTPAVSSNPIPLAKPTVAKTAVAKTLPVKSKGGQDAMPSRKPYVPVTNSPFEISIRKAAIGAKLAGAELSAFLAQCAHESAKFTTTKEFADGSQYEGRKDLGNVNPGDGVKYKGRGFIQITGRANYTQAAKDLGIDLVNHPELAERPDIATKVSLWYWKTRVQPKISNFTNTKAVTKKVNGGVNGLQQRTKLTKSFQVANK